MVVAALPGLAVAVCVGNHAGDDRMGLRRITVHQHEEIRRRLAEGRRLRSYMTCME